MRSFVVFGLVVLAVWIFGKVIEILSGPAGQIGSFMFGG